ncbi:MAG: hypothetical protein R2749_22610 [Acidimicrobiales bacterium]
MTNGTPFTRLDIISCRNLFIYLNADLQARVLRGSTSPYGPAAPWCWAPARAWASRRSCSPPSTPPARSSGRRRARPLFDWGGEREPIGRLRPEERTPPPVRCSPCPRRACRCPRRWSAWPSSTCRHRCWWMGAVRSATSSATCPSTCASLPVRPGCASPTWPGRRCAPLAAGLSRALRTGELAAFPASTGGEDEAAGAVAVRVLPVGDGPGRRSAMVVFERPGVPLADLPMPADTVLVQLEELQVELQRARAEQQSLVEQLEGSNEELQAANEEMVAANEELQATNEELQSVNEELFTVNAENARRIGELEVLRADLDHLLAATDVARWWWTTS